MDAVERALVDARHRRRPRERSGRRGTRRIDRGARRGDAARPADRWMQTGGRAGPAQRAPGPSARRDAGAAPRAIRERHGERDDRLTARPARRPAPTSRDSELRARAWIAAAVVDPEIPVLTLEDLGVLRGVEMARRPIVVKSRRPTPAARRRWSSSSRSRRARRGRHRRRAGRDRALAAWTTDQITRGRPAQAQGVRHRAAGGARRRARALFGAETVACPQCGSTETAKSPSSARPPARRCGAARAAREPFDYFKCI